MERRLEPETLSRLVDAHRVDDLTVPELIERFRHEDGLDRFLPDGVYQVDPRDGAVVTFNSARARRPHDTKLADEPGPNGAGCPICDGFTTRVVDVAALSDGHTFINKNLFPVLSPPEAIGPEHVAPAALDGLRPNGQVAHGLHFLQWTSTAHDRDWHNLSPADCRVVLERLAALEGKLLWGSREVMPPTDPAAPDGGTSGFVSIIKNHGRPVGGSLSHGHQQIAFSNVMPRRMTNNLRFLEARGETFSAYMRRVTPPELVVRDYGPAVLVVPYFMRRPYDMLLLLKDDGLRHLSDLDGEALAAVAGGWHDAVRAILEIMPRVGRVPAYNATVNNGPGAGLYVEFLPYTQETGGLEHLGLWICQSNPAKAAADLRAALDAPAED